MKRTVVILIALCIPGCSGHSGSEITASGTIEGTDVQIGAQVAAKVSEVRVDEGSRVRAGDTLVVLDASEYNLQLRQAEANLGSFESAYRLVADGSRKEDIVQAEAAAKTAEADFVRMKDLLPQGAATQKQYDDAYSKQVAAEQNYEKLKKGSRPEEIDNARQKRELAAAQVDLLKKKVHDCTITAPSAGTITLRAVEPGELVGYGTNVLKLTYLDKVKLTIYVSEQELGGVRLGQTARVTIDASPDKPFNGTVTYVSSVAEFTPKNIQTKEDRTKLVFGVKIEIPNPDGILKAGMPADASLPVSAL